MGVNQSKKRCKICSTRNKDQKSHICEECNFIPIYITKFGRENLKRIINNSYSEFENPMANEYILDRRKTIIDKAEKKIEVINIQPSAPTDCNESSTDDCDDNYNIKQIQRCKSVNCSCKDRYNTNQYRTSIYNPPSYPTN